MKKTKEEMQIKHKGDIIMSLIVILFIITCSTLLSGCSFLKGMKPDSMMEEVVEEIIEGSTGIELDLSPGSPEDGS